MNNKDLIFLTIITFLLTSILSTYFHFRKEIRKQTSLYESVSDTLKTYKNKNGEYVAKILAIEVEREKDFTSIKNLTEIAKELQDLVKQKSKEVSDLKLALILKEETVIEITDTVYVQDPEQAIMIKNLVLMNTYEDKWLFAHYGINKGLYKLDVKITNEYDITLGYERKNIFHKTKPYVEVVNKNPYTKTSDLKAYIKAENEKKFSIGLQGGIGFNYGLINKNIDFGPQLGFGFNYKLF